MKRFNPFTATFHIPYSPPQELHIYLLLNSIGGVSCIVIATIPLSVKAILIISIALYLYYRRSEYKAAQRLENKPLLILDKANNWQLVKNSASVEVLTLLDNSFVHPRLTIMRFRKENGKKINFIFTGSNLNSDMFRRLRVRLLHDDMGSRA